MKVRQVAYLYTIMSIFLRGESMSNKVHKEKGEKSRRCQITTDAVSYYRKKGDKSSRCLHICHIWSNEEN